MPSLSYPAQKMRDATTGKIVVFVSRGRDAATMAHIMLQVVPKDRLEFVNLWYYPNLEYQQKQLVAWEKFFGIQIHRHPAEEVAAIVGGKQQLRFGDVREWIRDKYAAEWVAYGYRMDESLARRALLKPHPDGIHYAQKTLYPLRQFNQKTVIAYCAKWKIPLAPEYRFGYRDISIFDGETARWLRDAYPADFERACAFDPLLAAKACR